MGKTLLTVCALIFSAPLSAAEPFDPKDLPTPLKEWIPWVLHQKPICPVFHSGATHCAFVGKLSLAVGATSGSFELGVEVFSPTDVPLPGDTKAWPQDLTLELGGTKTNGAMTDRGARPFVHLTRGRYKVSGKFFWAKTPQNLAVPTEYAQIDLTVAGREQRNYVHDKSGFLWLGQATEEGSQVDRLDVRVHRLIVDSLPQTVTTHIAVEVTGAAREVLIGPVSLAGAIPTGVSSNMPALLGRDGMIRLQAKPGQASIHVTANFAAPADSFKSQGDSNWPAEEIWAFDDQPQIRTVTVEGAELIDPKQTTLPEAWREFPAYVLSPDSELKLVETSRGLTAGRPSQLTLHRELFADDRGTGFTLRDNIQGSTYELTRLQTVENVELGQAQLNSEDQFISVSNDRTGIELRSPEVSVTAVSRINKSTLTLPTVGWNAPMKSVHVTMQLPRAAGALYVSDADEQHGTWLARLDIVDYALLAVVVALSWFLLGARFAAVAGGLAVLALFSQPTLLWFLLTAIVLPSLWQVQIRFVAMAVRFAVVLVCLGLGAVAYEFAHDELNGFLGEDVRRRSILGELSNLADLAKDDAPQEPVMAMTEQQADSGGSADSELAEEELAEGFAGDEVDADKEAKFKADAPADAAMVPPAAPAPEAAAPAGVNLRKLGVGVGKYSNAYGGRQVRSATRGGLAQTQLLNVKNYNPNLAVQTGPGVPDGSSNRINFSWTQEVPADATFKVWIVPKWANQILALLRLVLLGAFCFLLIRISWRRSQTVMATLLLSVSAFAISPDSAQAEIPTPQLLQELQERLMAKPDCSPSCVVLNRMDITVSGGIVSMTLAADSRELSALPIPGKDWQIKSATANDQPAGLFRDTQGVSWVALKPGQSTIKLQMTNQPPLRIDFILKPRFTQITAPGHQITGVDANGISDSTIELIASGSDAAEDKTANAVQPFVIVERSLTLDLTWSVTTTVSRRSQTGMPISMSVPLLPGEAVTSDTIRVDNQKAIVTIAGDEHSVSWASVMEPKETLVWVAAAGSMQEVWRIDPRFLWHVESKGTPLVGSAMTDLVWRPRPGEQLDLTIQLLPAAAGQTVTVDRATLNMSMGSRVLTHTLTATLRSSRGGQHTITLPKDVSPQTIHVNGSETFIPIKDGQLTIPTTSGRPTSFRIDWTATKSALVTTSPMISLGASGVNAAVSLEKPRDTWLIFSWSNTAYGPLPMIFFGLLASFILAVLLKEWLPVTPLQFLGLAAGLSQVGPSAIIALAALLLLIHLWRPTHKLLAIGRLLAVAIAALVVAICLVLALRQGLVGLPDMYFSDWLNWAVDRTDETLPQVNFFTLPLWLFRMLALGWAGWLGFFIYRHGVGLIAATIPSRAAK